MFFPKKNKLIKAFNFKKDQQGILNRYLREQNVWNEHLENTKQHIINCTERCAKDTIIVLGSGWWLDVPVGKLCDIYDKVYLVDIVHSGQIIHNATKMPKVELITTDITGNAAEVIYDVVELHKKKKIKTLIEDIKFDAGNFGIAKHIEASMVASVNILNQLDILLLDYLKKKDIYTIDELKHLRKKIQDAHIDALPKGKSCLITDHIELNKDTYTNEVIRTENLIYTTIPNDPEKEWVWQFDNHQTYHEDYNTHFKVGAYFF